MHAAASEPSIMQIPSPGYLVPSAFGNLELRPRADTELIGQPIDYSAGKTVAIQKISIDAMALSRVDLIKLDVQGIELEALEGAQHTIARCHPIFLLKSRKAAASACALSSTSAIRWSRPATTSSPCTTATRSSSSCSFPTCRRNQRPDRLTPSRRGPQAASAHTRRRRAPP
jgi:Methyltransferase FkbM domain